VRLRTWAVLGTVAVLVVVTTSVLMLRGREESRADSATTSREGDPSQPGESALTDAAKPTPEQLRQLYDAQAGALRTQIARVEGIVGRFSKESTDLDALSRSLPTPEAAFAFVRDRLAIEPYPGVMKGAAGTLIARGGNTLDRAILLAAILERHGITVKIARGSLPRSQAVALLQQISHSPDALEHIARSVPTVPHPERPETERQAAAALRLQADERARARHKAADDTVRTLAASLEKTGRRLSPDGQDSQVKVLEDHFWVQASIDGRQVDFDPSFKAAAPNQRLVDSAEAFSPGRLPASFYQRLSVRVIADVLEDGAVRTREILGADARAVDLLDANIRVAVEPQQMVKGQNAYVVSVAMGNAPAVVRPLELRQDTNGQSGGAAGGLLGGLSGDEPAEPTPQNPAGAVLGRLTIEILLTSPALGEARYRRVIVDRLDGEPHAPHLAAGSEDDDSIRPLLAQVWDGAIAVGASHPQRLFASQLQELTSQRAMIEQAMAEVYLARPMTGDPSGRPQVPRQLAEFFVYSSLAHHLIAAREGDRVRVYQRRPRLVFYRHGVVVHDWSKPGGPRRVQESIDLINMPYDVVGPHDGASPVRLRIGVGDTSLERAFGRQSWDFNTLALVEAATSQQIPLVTVGSAESQIIERLAVPVALRSVLRGELAAGRTLVAPTALTVLNEVSTFGWWSVDPESGVPLGQMELGAGQAVSETAALNKALLTGSHTFSKFYGGMLGCFFVEAADQLAPAGSTEVTPTFSFQKGHYIPGLPGIVTEKHTLAECLVEKMCEAVIEYAFLAAESVTWAYEVAHLHEQISEILGLIGPTAVSTWMHGCTPGGH